MRALHQTITAAMLAASIATPVSAEQLLCQGDGFKARIETVDFCRKGAGYEQVVTNSGKSLLIEVVETGANTADITCDGVVVQHCVYEHRSTSGGSSGGWSGGESLRDSRDRSAARRPGESSGATSTADDDGSVAGITANSN